MWNSLGQLLLCVGAQLQQTHEHRRHVHIWLPDGEASTNQIDGGAADGAVGGQLGAGGLQQQEGQGLTCKTEESQHRSNTFQTFRLKYFNRKTQIYNLLFKFNTEGFTQRWAKLILKLGMLTKNKSSLMINC